MKIIRRDIGNNPCPAFFAYLIDDYLFMSSLIFACAAANLAIGTLNGEHET